MAAGESSRFWPFNAKHKSLFNLAGRPLIWYTVQNLKKAGINDIIVVENSQKEPEKELHDQDIKFVVQEKPLGTGDAIYQAKSLITGNFLVIGPHKIDLNKYLPSVLQKVDKDNAIPVLVGVKTKSPQDYGMLRMENGKVAEIVENPFPGQEPSDIKATETYVLPADFFDFYGKVSPSEDSLIKTLNLIISQRGAELVVLDEETISLKYPWHLLNLPQIFFSSPYFKESKSRTVKIAKNVIINGQVFIGEGVAIAENTVINGPCFIGNNVQIGASNVLRGPVILEEGVKTGAFFEIKNSLVGKNTHFHSGYVGDSVIGEDCRFGAGFITANRRTDRNNIKVMVKGEKIDTGRNYLGMIASHNVRFGIHAGTMPGTIIGFSSLVGPGTMVFENIEDNTTVFTKFEKVVEKNK